MDESCYACRLEGPLCPACGLPVNQHTDPNLSFSVCADTLGYRLKRAAAYWENMRVEQLMQIFDEAGISDTKEP